VTKRVVHSVSHTAFVRIRRGGERGICRREPKLRYSEGSARPTDRIIFPLDDALPKGTGTDPSQIYLVQQEKGSIVAALRSGIEEVPGLQGSGLMRQCWVKMVKMVLRQVDLIV
jgi:hypothetical protein